MIDGTAASRSMTADSARDSFAGAYCTRKVAIPMATGTASSRAKSELSTVTLSRSRMPKRRFSGSVVFHSEEVKKLIWSAITDGTDWATRTIPIIPMRATMTAPAATVTPRKIASLRWEDLASRREAPPAASESCAGPEPEEVAPVVAAFLSASRSTDS